MKKILKVLGIFILVIILALIAIPYFFKDRIVEEVKTLANENLNATVDFSDVGLSFFKAFPKFSIDVQDISVVGKADFEGIQLAQIGDVRAAVDIMSLFGDKIKIREIGIIDPVFDVRVLKNGKANWDIALADSTAAEQIEVSEETEEEGAFSLGINNVYIENGKISYNDATLPMQTALTDFNFRADGDFTEDIFVLKSTLEAKNIDFIYDGTKYMRKGTTDIKADIDMDLANMKFTFAENTVRINQLPLAFDGWLSMPADDIDLDFTFAASKTDFKHLLSMVPAEFTKDLEGVDVTGKMACSGYAKGKLNDNSSPGFGVDLSVENGRFQYPDLPGSADNINIKANIDARDGNNLDAMTIDVPQFHVEMAGNPVDADLKLRTPMSDPDIASNIVAKLDFKKISECVPLTENASLNGVFDADIHLKGKMSSIEKEEYQDFEARGTLLLQDFTYSSDSLVADANIEKANLVFTPAHLDLSTMRGKFGRTDFETAGKLDNYLAYFLADEPLHGELSLNCNLVDLNEFMTDSAEEAAEDPAAFTVTSEEDEAAEGAIKVPGNINFEFDANIKQMKYENLVIDNTVGKIKIADEKISLSKLAMNLLQGKVTMSGDYISKETTPEIDFAFEVDKIDIQEAVTQVETMAEIAPIFKKCTGKMSTDLTLKGKLDKNMEPDFDSWDGRGTLESQSIDVKGVEGLRKLGEQLKMDKLKDQKIEDLKLTYVIRDGKVVTDPFVVKLDGIPATVQGYTGFDQSLDYSIKMDLPTAKLGKVAGQASGILAGLNEKYGTNVSVGGTIPVKVRITGTMDDQKFGLDMGDVKKGVVEDAKEQAKEQVKEIVNEKIDEGKDKAKAKAREEADKIIADAQERVDRLKADAKSTADRVHDEAYKAIQKEQDKAKNPLAKIAAQKIADKARETADKKRDQAIDKANKEADKIMDSARARAEAKIQAAEKL